MSGSMGHLPWENWEELYAAVNPVLVSAVATFLTTRRSVRIDVDDKEDLLNRLWLYFWQDSFCELMKWEPDKGEILPFVRMKAVSRLRDWARKDASRSRLAPTSSLEVDPRAETGTPEAVTAARDVGVRVDACLRSNFCDKPLQLRQYDLEVLRRQPPADVRVALNIDETTQYRLRHQIKQQLAICWESITGTAPVAKKRAKPSAYKGGEHERCRR